MPQLATHYIVSNAPQPWHAWLFRHLIKGNYEAHIEVVGINELPSQATYVWYLEQVEEGFCPLNAVNSFGFPLGFKAKEEEMWQAIACFLCRADEKAAPQDMHGRYEPLPLQAVYLSPWIDHLAHSICEAYNTFCEERQIKPLPKAKALVNKSLTVDIDNLTAFYGKPFLRRVGAAVRSIEDGDYKRAGANVRTRKAEVDPYFCFDFLVQSAQHLINAGWQGIFFLHLGNYGGFDKPLPWNERTKALWQQVIKLGKESGWQFGLHPSYEAATNDAALQQEIQRFEELLSYKPTLVRMHYLRQQIPDSFIRLTNYGFKQDYTLGFAGQNGFRAGTAKAINAFDWQTQKELRLSVHPFCWMDTTSRDARQFSIDEAKVALIQLQNQIKHAGQEFTLIFHNESFSRWHRYNGWHELLRSL